jgi:RNA polymerase sigma factor (sigma-70 family)
VHVLGRQRRTEGEEAFESLFRREFAPLVRALTLVAGDREAAADAVQDAFVQAHRHRERVLAMESPAGWLRHVALNRIRNHHRGHDREADALPRLAALTSMTAAAPDADDAGFAATALLATLAPQQRSAAAMYYLLDQSTSAIAEHLGITEATVRSHLRTARQRLAEHFNEERA